MEFTTDFITEQKFTPEQITAINGVIVDAQDAASVAELKKGWDDTASVNADAIISGAITATQEANNFTLPQDKGEKLKDWQLRYSAALLGGKQTELDASKKDYDEKVKNFQGDANIKAELIAANEKLDPLLKQKAAYDELLGSGVKEAYEALVKKSNADTILLAYGSVKPVFHKDIDSRIINYEWDKFVNETQGKYSLELINGEWVGIEKDNKHAQKPLKELIKSNEDLTKLIDGRKQDPLNADATEVSTVTGVPFGVPKDVSNKDLSELINKHLASEGLTNMGRTANEYSKRFQELNALARGQKTAE